MIAITGATGHIGSRLTESLLLKGRRVRAIGRSEERLRPYVENGAEAAVGDLADTEFLIGAFSGAGAVFSLIPPDYTASDFRGYQNTIGESIARAIEAAGVKHVVNLSSQGAQLSEGTGPIMGLRDHEERLNKLAGINIVHLRPTYFMENLLMQVPLIKSKGVMGSAIRGDLRFAMIATVDIARAASEYLLARAFTGSSVRDLLGQRDLMFTEVAAIIGEKIGMPGLPYVQFSYEDAEKGMVAAGLSEDVSRLMVEMIRRFNEEIIGANLVRTTENTTETSIEEFAETFAQIYKGQA